MAGTDPHASSARRSEYLAVVAGAATVSAIALASGLVIGRMAADGQAGPLEAVHLGALVVFSAAFFPVAGPWVGEKLDRAAPSLLLVATLAAATAVASLPQFGLAPVLFILTAAMAAHVVGTRWAYALIATQTLVVVLSTLRVSDDVLAVAVPAIAYGGFQVFALTTTVALLTERQLRRSLALANAELRGARALLEATSRQGERLRIARDLHDLIGHHLTALALHLEVADHLTDGRAKLPVERSRAIARLLLADVRGVVGDLRSHEVDVVALLREMVADLPRPLVHVDVPDTLEVVDDERAQTVLRLVQEALTNALRHGEAERVWISLRHDGDALTVEVRDDGRGAPRIEDGNGLRGMRERVAAVAGQLDLVSAPGQGFTVRARVPLRGAEA
jgi:signal transduction histidine kinase